MKRALVLAGGGARGAFQVGMLRGLVKERNLDFQIIRGVSVGALNAAFLAQAPSQPDSLAALQAKVDELEGIWRNEIRGNDSVYEERPGGFLGLAAGADSLYSLEPLERLVRGRLSLDALRASGRDFGVGVVSLVTGEFAEATPPDTLFLEKLISSASIPVVFPYADLKSLPDVLVDGGARDITPLSSAFHAGPDEIYVLLTSRLIRTGDELPRSGVMPNRYQQWDDNWLGTKVSGLDVLKRTLDILTDEVYLDDLRSALAWNEIARSVEEAAQQLPSGAAEKLRRSLGRKRSVPIHVLAPQEWFGDDNSSIAFSPDRIARAVAHGEEIARDPARWLWPPG